MFRSVMGGLRPGYGHDPNVVVTHESYAEKSGNAFCGACVGIVLFFMSLSMVAFNEYNFVATEKAINEAMDAFVEGSCNVDPAFDNKLVHASCNLGGFETFVSSPGVPASLDVTGLSFSRTVEVYQWEESSRTESKKDAVGGGTTKVTTYSYSKKWSASPVSTSSFTGDCSAFNSPSYQACINPTPVETCGTTTQIATAPTFGDFDLPTDLVAGLGSSRAVTPQAEGIWATQGTYLMKGAGTDAGDQRISFTVSTATDASIIALQKGNTYQRWKSEYDVKYGMYSIVEGKVAADSMFSNALASNVTMTWLLRFVGFGLCWMGLNMVAGPLSVLPDIVPCIGPFVGDLLGSVLCCATGLVAVIFTTLVAATAWLVYRPMIGIPLLIVALTGCGCLVYISMKYKKDPAAKPSPAGAAAPTVAAASAYAGAPGAAYAGAPGAEYAVLAPGYAAPAPGYAAPGYAAPGYAAPAPGYAAPAPGYATPAPGYAAPAPGYAAPAPGYAAPAPGYAAPAPGYAAPAPGYAAPASGYAAPPVAGYPPSGAYN